MNKNNLVVKTNRLNQAFQVLSLAELHIIQLAIVDARETGTGLSSDTPLRIDALRYAEAFDTTRQNGYQRMKEAEETLFNRRFSFYDVDGHLVKSRWVSQVKYFEDEGALEIIFTPAVVKGITSIDGRLEHYTKYLISQTSSLTSVYAARLYELLIQWKSFGKVPMIKLEEFRDQLGLGINEYIRMSDLKKRVLELAINQINQHTDITASYEQHKRGRVIVGFSFKFKQKKIEADKFTSANTRNKDIVDMFSRLTDAQIKRYSAILSRVHDISDLAGTRDYGAFEAFLADILRDPSSVREETAERIFKALHTETDFKDGNS